jgi:hypothetical protein
MAGAAYRDFAELIAVEERIEILAKAGKLFIEPSKGSHFKKRDSEVNQVQSQKDFVPCYPQLDQRNQSPIYLPTPTYFTKRPLFILKMPKISQFETLLPSRKFLSII